MAGIYETGHAKNVANFETLILAIEGYGDSYNPGNDSIQITNLSKLLETAGLKMSDLNIALAKNSISMANRDQVFSPLRPISTRILNTVGSCGTTPQIFNSVRSLVHKIQGIRAKAKLTEEEKAALAAQGAAPKEISSSQTGFINRIDFLDKLIQLLAIITQYSPNEGELKVVSLTSYYNTLKAVNTDALAVENQLNNARLSRNEALYTPVNGLIDTAKTSKMYIKSAFGARSTQYKQISKLVFREITI